MWQHLYSSFHALLTLGILGLICIIAQKLFPSIHGQKIWRKESRLDLAYWLLTSLITLNAITFFAALVLTFIALLSPEITAAINSAASDNPKPLNVIMALILLDFSGYWTHRLLHGRRLWKFHAIHHSSPEIDWLSSSRFHPIESIIVVVIGFNVCMLAGFSIKTIGAVMAIRGLYGYIVHANVTWDYGPLGYIIASPYFHRWHHTTDKEALDKNFAGVFSLWDFIFGTAYMPKKIQPCNFGVTQNIGTSFWQQLIYPFKQI